MRSCGSWAHWLLCWELCNFLTCRVLAFIPRPMGMRVTECCEIAHFPAPISPLIFDTGYGISDATKTWLLLISVPTLPECQSHGKTTWFCDKNTIFRKECEWSPNFMRPKSKGNLHIHHHFKFEITSSDT